jgi:DMSO/TMAO reductase YedYZ heme-binding membrane subunit
VIVIVAMLAFAVLDVAEVVHQLDTSRAGLAIMAAIVAALHLGAAGTSGAMLRTSEP